jgi:2,4-dienoyl-CoA reductase-like NADH-dependent reductase (Old Yellow Enzyme family)
MPSLKYVLQPIQLGSITVPNRIVRAAHGTGIGRGTLNEELIEYHVARARGGVGLTILEMLSPPSSAYPHFVAGAPGLLDGYRRLVDRVRPYGMRLFQQLGHMGNEVAQADGGPPISSSDSVGALAGIPAEPMSSAMILSTINDFTRAAIDAERCGLDGVELHFAHGYLVQQFLSPLHNHRTDEYGGSFENRTRLAIELLSAVRAACSPQFVVGVRLSTELVPGGMTSEDVAGVAVLFQERGLIDYVNLSIGTDYNFHKIIGGMHEPLGYEIPSDVPIKRAVRLPVIVSGRFRTLAEADQVIRDGNADLVSMVRAHIADPDIVSKSREGREQEVRPCIGCNHGCLGGLMSQGLMGCTVNVAVGRESVLAEQHIKRTNAPRAVLVIGGGPAGLEAARVAALCGHRVVLAEATKNLGGSVSIARLAPHRRDIGDIIDWLESENYRLGVDVRLNTYVEAQDVMDLKPDVLIVATGSQPRKDGRHMFAPGRNAAGMEMPHVVSSHELLLGKVDRNWGRRALVYDDVGHYEAIAAAEFLIERQVAVTFVTGHASFCPGVSASASVVPALERLGKGDFRLITHGRIVAVEERMTHVSCIYARDPIDVLADTVVFVSHNAPNRGLLDELSGFPKPVLAVGDVRSPRFLQTAIREGHLAARSIG